MAAEISGDVLGAGVWPIAVGGRFVTSAVTEDGRPGGPGGVIERYGRPGIALVGAVIEVLPYRIGWDDNRCNRLCWEKRLGAVRIGIG